MFSLAIQFQAHADIVKIISKIFAIQKPCFIFISKLLQLQQCEIFRRYENASVLQFNSKHIVEQFLFTIQPTFFELGGGGSSGPSWLLLCGQTLILNIVRSGSICPRIDCSCSVPLGREAKAPESPTQTVCHRAGCRNCQTLIPKVLPALCGLPRLL